MVRIRLQRAGRKKRPQYRVIVADQRMPRDGRFIENVGLYFPLEPVDRQVRIDTDRIKHWLSQGAQPTQTVRTLLHRVGVFEGETPHYGKPDQPNKRLLAAQEKAAAEAAAAEARTKEEAEAEAAAKAKEQAEATAKAEDEAVAAAQAEEADSEEGGGDAAE